MKTVKVKPWGEGQGDHVLINEADLTDEHVLINEAVSKPEPKPAVKPQTKSETSA